MKIKFLGAAGTVTGSCYLLTASSGQSILIDCGAFQGTADLEQLNYAKLDIDCSKVSGLVLTHAHLDHCGRLPTLLSQGFNQPIWMTEPTRDITEISLLDSAKINKENTSRPALFTKEDVDTITGLFKTVEYDTNFTIGTFSVVMRDAGHILGSTSLEITDSGSPEGSNKAIFSGDLGNSPEDLIRATETVKSGDVVVMESTYGGSIHPTDNPSDVIQSEINTIEQKGGTLLIPAFSIERSQELLHRISHLKRSGKVKNETQVFFDSPMGEKTTVVFEKYSKYYNDELKTDLASSNPFEFPGLTHVENADESKSIDRSAEPKVIMAGSGMMTGGRIMFHAAHYLPIPTTRLLIVGYQADGTLGRLILDGQKNVTIEGHEVQIQANVNQTQAMSSHADQPRLLSWLKNIQGTKKLFLTHGEDGPRSTLAQKVTSDLQISDITLPTLNQEAEINS